MKRFIKTGLIFIVQCLFIGFSSNAQNKITSYQYWFDNDYNTNNIVPVTPAEQANLATMLPLENMNGGLHIISIRFKDNKGQWSVPVNQYFYKSNSISQDNKIVAYRYWLNEDMENAKYISLGDPVQLLNLNEDLDFSDKISGAYVIHFQFRDASDKWSLVTSDNFTVSIISAIENTYEKTFDIYPNPTSGLIRIESDSEFSLECALEVYDYYGRIVMLKQLKKENNQEIDLSQLSKGIYYMRIKDKSNYLYQKVLLK